MNQVSMTCFQTTPIAPRCINQEGSNPDTVAKQLGARTTLRDVRPLRPAKWILGTYRISQLQTHRLLIMVVVTLANIMFVRGASERTTELLPKNWDDITSKQFSAWHAAYMEAVRAVENGWEKYGMNGTEYADHLQEMEQAREDKIAVKAELLKMQILFRKKKQAAQYMRDFCDPAKRALKRLAQTKARKDRETAAKAARDKTQKAADKAHRAATNEHIRKRTSKIVDDAHNRRLGKGAAKPVRSKSLREMEFKWDRDSNKFPEEPVEPIPTHQSKPKSKRKKAAKSPPKPSPHKKDSQTSQTSGEM